MKVSSTPVSCQIRQEERYLGPQATVPHPFSLRNRPDQQLVLFLASNFGLDAVSHHTEKFPWQPYQHACGILPLWHVGSTRMPYIATNRTASFLNKRLRCLSRMQAQHLLISVGHCMMRLREPSLFSLPSHVPQLGRNDPSGAAQRCILVARPLVG